VEWSFVMEGIEADTSEAALSIAETNINSMVLIHASSDVKEDGKRTWYCIYAHISHPTIRAAAISPIIDIQKTRKKI